MSTLKSKLYQLVSQIPAGQVTTYKLLGDALNTRAYRHLGQLLSQNPNPKAVPCHRVVKSNGQIGGYLGKNSPKAKLKKKALLQKEGVKFDGFALLDFSLYLHHPSGTAQQAKL